MKTNKQVFDTSKSVLEELKSEFLTDHGVRLFVKRDDLIHPVVSGNKWRKLKYNVEKSFHKKKTGILTFGGAYSNHLVATAFACKEAGLKAIGLVRGDELDENSNETLQKCHEYGMQLIFISRMDYALRYEKSYWEELSLEHPGFMIVPEGGAGYLGMIGCQEIVNELDQEYDAIFVAQGTTTTSCGILLGMPQDKQLYVVPVLKNFNSTAEMRILMVGTGIESELVDSMMENVTVLDQYHFGGYAKYDGELITFISDFYQQYDLKLDPVYTGKAMYALFDQIRKGEMENKSVVFVHTGGLQGVSGVEKKLGHQLFSS